MYTTLLHLFVHFRFPFSCIGSFPAVCCISLRLAHFLFSFFFSLFSSCHCFLQQLVASSANRRHLRKWPPPGPETVQRRPMYRSTPISHSHLFPRVPLRLLPLPHLSMSSLWDHCPILNFNYGKKRRRQNRNLHTLDHARFPATAQRQRGKALNRSLLTRRHHA